MGTIVNSKLGTHIVWRGARHRLPTGSARIAEVAKALQPNFLDRRKIKEFLALMCLGFCLVCPARCYSILPALRGCPGAAYSTLCR